MMNDSQLLTALIINRLPSLRATERRILFDAALTPDQYRRVTITQIAEIVGRRLRPRAFDRAEILLLAERDYRYLQMSNIKAMLVEQMPFLLQKISDPPFLLFVRGTLFSADEKMLAVVGTRRPSAAAVRAAFAVGAEMASEGLTLVSGLARGVDGSAMNGAVRDGGRVVAVLGNGIDHIYPRQHQQLAGRILEQGGAIVSEYSPGTEPLRYHFPARNRIISALSRAVLLIEAPQRSGALITAEYALEQGRDLFVHAVTVDQGATATTAGGNALIANGARVISSVRQLHSLWGCFGIEEIPCNESVPHYYGRSIKYHVDLLCQRPIYTRVAG